MEMHRMLGYATNNYVKSTAEYYGWMVHGNDVACEDCATAKVQQASIPKSNSSKSDVPGERFNMDISLVKGFVQQLKHNKPTFLKLTHPKVMYQAKD